MPPPPPSGWLSDPFSLILLSAISNVPSLKMPAPKLFATLLVTVLVLRESLLPLAIKIPPPTLNFLFRIVTPMMSTEGFFPTFPIERTL